MRTVKQAAALKYEPGKDNAPVVVASGRGPIAEKIIEIAKDNNVPLFGDEESASILCSLPVGSEIPEILYQAVAEIYAYILQVENQSQKTQKVP